MTLCAYCRERRAVNRDHVVPQSLQRKHAPRRPTLTVVLGAEQIYRSVIRPPIPPDLLGTVPSCFECNNRKGTRRLVPPDWKSKVPALNAFFGGAPWRVWDGNPRAQGFREVHHA